MPTKKRKVGFAPALFMVRWNGYLSADVYGTQTGDHQSRFAQLRQHFILLIRGQVC